MNHQINAINTIEYQVVYKIKYLTEEDTTFLNGNCWLQKVPEDTLLGLKARLKQDNGYEHVYTTNELYVFDHTKKKATVGDPKMSGTKLIEGNVVKHLIFKELIWGVNLNELKADSAKITLLPDTASSDYWILQIIFPAKGEISDKVKKIWICKQTYIPKRMEYSVKLEGMIQYSEIIISDIKINDKKTPGTINKVEIPDNYTIEKYRPTSSSEYKLLDNGRIPPDFILNGLDGRLYQISKLKGKVVLLDFWYMSCYPCLKALPVLEKIHNKFKDDGIVVLGINSKDRHENTDKIRNFLLNREITYTVLLGNHTVDSTYNIKVYPSLYLISKDGNIVFSDIGYYETLLDTLEQKILLELKK